MIGRRSFLKSLAALALVPKERALKSLYSLEKAVAVRFPTVFVKYNLGFMISKEMIEDDMYASQKVIANALATKQKDIAEAYAHQIDEWIISKHDASNAMVNIERVDYEIR